MGVVSCGIGGLVVAYVGRRLSLAGRRDNVSYLSITEISKVVL